MFAVRRVEVTCDQEYKARRIRGFCHLYDGQEAISTGTEAALTRDDDWITTYRCHGVAMARGCTPTQVFAEQFGGALGASRGKGGSMHLYRKESHFYGGAAIVGAHVPIAAGLALFHKYVASDPKKMQNASFVFYGDGAANQGQCWEAANMATLWKLPVVFVIENNQYGMGTAVQRSSALTEYYKQGGEVIPGVQVNGMDVLAVKTAMGHAKEHVMAGNGPLFVEAKTYRYHGHSMSDPGITYRSREEVAKTRAERDPIELVKSRLLDSNLATADELKEIEREVRDQVQNALAEATAGKAPEVS
jgi:pyruvate dehydrogenase E1 component alpha subunit